MEVLVSTKRRFPIDASALKAQRGDDRQAKQSTGLSNAE